MGMGVRKPPIPITTLPCRLLFSREERRYVSFRSNKKRKPLPSVATGERQKGVNMVPTIHAPSLTEHGGLSAQTAPVVLLIETENGTQRMTVSQYNAAGGMAVMQIWKNPEALNLRAARQLLAAVPSVIR